MKNQKKPPILVTKFYKPELKHNYIYRDIIISRLEENFDRPLTLVVAATGYGKSVTISEWLDVNKSKYCWISLDDSFNNFRTFLEYLAFGLNNSLNDPLVELNNLLDGEELPPHYVIFNTLINELDEIQEKMILVLDDYHTIKNDAIHDLINELLTYFPRRLHLVIISRSDPPLKLSGLKTFGQVNEIRMIDLKFDSKEFLSLSKKLTGFEIDQDLSEHLLQKTEGWIVGLLLALDRISQNKNFQKSLEEINGNKNFITEYLLDEVFLHLSKAEQNILALASCFERFSMELLKFVWLDRGKTSSADNETNINGIFDQLKRPSLFIIVLDDNKEWFRFHHFFRDFLVHYFQKNTTPETRQEFHRRASQYFYSKDLFEEAIHHAVISNDSNQLARIFLENKYNLLDLDNFNLLSKWINAIPEEYIVQEPHLILTRALFYDTKGDYISMQNDLEIAKKLLDKDKKITPQNRPLWGEYHSISCCLSYMSGKIEDANKHFRTAIKYLSVGQFYFREFVLAMGAFATVASKYPEEAISLVKNYLNDVPSSHTASRMRSKLVLSLLYSFKGDLNTIEELVRQYRPFFDKNGRWVSLSYANYLLGEVHYQRNELTQVFKYADQVEEHKYAGRPFWVLNCMATKAFTLQAQKRYEELHLTLATLNTLARDYDLDSCSRFVKVCEVELALRESNIQKAFELADGLVFEIYPPIYYFFFPQLTQIKLLLNAKDKIQIDEAKILLENIIEFGRATLRQNLLIQALPIQALLYSRNGSMEQAVEIINEVISITEPSGYIRTFLDLGNPMEKLLKAVSDSNPQSSYVKKILYEFKKEKQNTGAEVIIDKKFGITENLTVKEIELLNLVAKGLKNKEIADKLFLSVDSIKKYLYFIYQKLGVNNRVAAVAKASDQKFINTFQ